MKTKMKTPVMVRVGALQKHPQNDFKDIVAERWDAFLKAIKLDGVLHPIYINSKHQVLSGAQRVRACKSLGIKTIPAIMLPPMTAQEERYFIIDMNMGRGLSSEDLQKYLLERYAREFKTIVDDFGKQTLEKRKAVDKILSSGVVKREKVFRIAKKQHFSHLQSNSDVAINYLSASAKREVISAKAKAASFKQKARDLCDQHNAQIDLISKHIKPVVLKVSKIDVKQHQNSEKIGIKSQPYRSFARV